MNKEAKDFLYRQGLSDYDYMDDGMIGHIAENMQKYHLEQLALTDVNQQRKLLIAYEKNHYTPIEWVLAGKQCIKDIDNFLRNNR